MPGLRFQDVYETLRPTLATSRQPRSGYGKRTTACFSALTLAQAVFDQARYGLPVIEHDSDIPVYMQLAAILRAQIESGELQPRRPVPSIRTLVETYGVADGTVQKAFRVLREEGLVRTVQGKGVFVVDRS